MINFNNIDFSYQNSQVKILENFSLSLPDNKLIAFLGKSGAGKTTLFRLILKLEKPTSGEINAPKQISMMFQEDRLLPQLSLLENVSLVNNDPNQAIKILKDMGLATEIHSKPDEISGGMQRRVALARALNYPHEVLLLDEALKGLDLATKDEIEAVILREKEAKTVIMISHQPDEAARLADKIYIFEGSPLKIKKQITLEIPASTRTNEYINQKIEEISNALLNNI